MRGERGRYEETISITINKPVLRDELQDVGHSIASVVVVFFFLPRHKITFKSKGT